MKKLAALIGRLLYWLGWPVLYLAVGHSQRTRTLVVCGGEVLLVKVWIGDGSWSLPGGGLRGREPRAAGAARELLEETGIQVAAGQLRSLGSVRAKERAMPITHHFFAVELPGKPNLKLERIELAEAVWWPLGKLPSRLRADTRAGLRLLARHGRLL